MSKRFVAKSYFVPFSHFKMRSLADAYMRGKRADVALNYLKTSALKRALPLEKLLRSAIANAVHSDKIQQVDLVIKEICIDQGPMRRYFKPGAMGRANVQKKRFSHLKIILEPMSKQKEV